METLGKHTETCLLLRWQSLICYYTSLPLSLSLSLSYRSYSSDLTSFTISRKRHLSYEVLSDKRPKRHLNTPGGGGERKTGREADPDCVFRCVPFIDLKQISISVALQTAGSHLLLGLRMISFKTETTGTHSLEGLGRFPLKTKCRLCLFKRP